MIVLRKCKNVKTKVDKIKIIIDVMKQDFSEVVICAPSVTIVFRAKDYHAVITVYPKELRRRNNMHLSVVRPPEMSTSKVILLDLKSLQDIKRTDLIIWDEDVCSIFFNFKLTSYY